VVVPAVIFPTVTFAVLFLWPAIERRLTGDEEEHHLLDRPRNRQVRTAVGVAVLTFYVVLFVGGSQEVIVQKLGVSIEPVTWTLRVAVIVLPLLTGAIAYAVCRDLAAEKSLEQAGQEREPPTALAEEPAELVTASERPGPTRRLIIDESADQASVTRYTTRAIANATTAHAIAFSAVSSGASTTDVLTGAVRPSA
jgi:hypothetical protein